MDDARPDDRGTDIRAIRHRIALAPGTFMFSGVAHTDSDTKLSPACMCRSVRQRASPPSCQPFRTRPGRRRRTFCSASSIRAQGDASIPTTAMSRSVAANSPATAMTESSRRRDEIALGRPSPPEAPSLCACRSSPGCDRTRRAASESSAELSFVASTAPSRRTTFAIDEFPTGGRRCRCIRQARAWAQVIDTTAG